MSNIIITGSILSADFTKLGEEVRSVLAAGVDWIHFDVMDHHFVPNLSFGSLVCRSLRAAGITAPIDVHLMVTDPEKYIDDFADAGANMLTFHAKTVNNPLETFKLIRQRGMQVGLAVNPDEAIEEITDYLPLLDILLIMSVYPGFGGQSFIPESLEKIRQAKQLIKSNGHQTYLSVDGGIKLENIGKIVQAGANCCVLGSGLFSATHYPQHVIDLRKAISGAR